MQGRSYRQQDRDGHHVIRVLLVGGEGGIRPEVGKRIAQAPDLLVAASVSGSAAAVETLRRSAFDVILVDAAALGSDGSSVIRSVAGAASACPPAVAVGPDGDVRGAARLLASGAMAYVVDGAPASELAEAIRAARAGRRYISASLRDRMAFHYIDGQ
jgi:DNA-binding NarL/FixJ family response regulator